MASSIPVMSRREVVSKFEKLGWRFVRQKGSHIILVKTGEMVTLSVTDHREVAKRTLRKLIRIAGITVDDFLNT